MERILQQVFLFQFSIFPAVVLATILIYRLDLGRKTAPIIAGSLIPDIFSGFPFGFTVIPMMIMCIIFFMADIFFGFHDSILSVVPASLLLVAGYLLILSGLAHIPMEHFTHSFLIIWFETVAILMAQRLARPFFNRYVRF